MTPYHKHSRHSSSPEYRIFAEGFASGLFAGIAWRTGIHADPSSVITQCFDALIKAGESINPDENYGFYKGIFAFGMFICGILGFIETMSLGSNRFFGFILFGMGFICALILCLMTL